jgi:hypothetical protein
MVERDYLMRQIQAFAKALAQVILRKKDRQLDEALKEINDAFSEDREAQGVVDLPLEEFIARIDYMEDFDAQKWALVAELLYEQGDILKRQAFGDQGNVYFIKALHLALEVLLSDPETYRPGTVGLVQDLMKEVSVRELPNATLGLLVEYEGGEN